MPDSDAKSNSTVPAGSLQNKVLPFKRPSPTTTGKRLARKPLTGYADNPLLKLPPNSKCPCLSGKKFKACCREMLPPVVTVALAAEYAKQMAKPDLVFNTPHNQEAIAARVNAFQAACPSHDWETTRVELTASDCGEIRDFTSCRLCGMAATVQPP